MWMFWSFSNFLQLSVYLYICFIWTHFLFYSICYNLLYNWLFWCSICLLCDQWEPIQAGLCVTFMTCHCLSISLLPGTTNYFKFNLYLVWLESALTCFKIVSWRICPFENFLYMNYTTRWANKECKDFSLDRNISAPKNELCILKRTMNSSIKISAFCTS